MATERKYLLPATFQPHEPLSDSVLQEFEHATNIKLPEDYVGFLKQANGGEGALGSTSYAVLWRLQELVEMNKAYQVEEYAPGLLLFGSDGGGEAFAFDMRSTLGPVFSVPFVGISLEVSQKVGSNFGEFLEKLLKS